MPPSKTVSILLLYYCCGGGTAYRNRLTAALNGMGVKVEYDGRLGVRTKPVTHPVLASCPAHLLDLVRNDRRSVMRLTVTGTGEGYWFEASKWEAFLEDHQCLLR